VTKYLEIEEYEEREFPQIQGPINQDAEKYLTIYQMEDNKHKIAMHGYIGVIKLTPTQTLISNPKICIENVLRMYNYVNSKVKFGENEIALAKEQNFLDILSHLFIKEVEAICRNRFRRFYRDAVDNLTILKGKILVAETIQRNLYSPHIVCEYSEFTENIIENQVIKYAIYLQMKAYTRTQGKVDLYAKLRNLYTYFSNVTLRYISPDEISGIIYNRLNQGYREAHYLSKFFIEHLYIRHGVGETTFYSFMINMNQLFENFVRSILRKYNTNYRVKNENKMNLTLDHTDKNIIKIKPDIILEQNNKTEYIIDCKYKRIKTIEEDKEVDASKPYPSDVYQILTYMVAQKCTKGVLIYPKGEAEDTVIKVQVENETYTIKVKQIDLTNLEEDRLIAFARQIDN